jgi:hypothetical protein
MYQIKNTPAVRRRYELPGGAVEKSHRSILSSSSKYFTLRLLDVIS